MPDATTRKFPQMPDDLAEVSSRRLRGILKATSREFERIKEDPFRSLPLAEATAARAEALSAASVAAEDAARVQRELQRRQRERDGILGSRRGPWRSSKERREHFARQEREQVEERRAEYAAMQAGLAEREARQLTRLRDRGMLYEPLGGWEAGDALAAVFSSSVLWEAIALRPGPNSAGVELFAEDILVLFWALARVSEDGGQQFNLRAGHWPHFPLSGRGDDPRASADASLRRLIESGFLTSEGGGGTGSVRVMRPGPRVVALQEQYRARLVPKAPPSAREIAAALVPALFAGEKREAPAA